jgi:hypothetical protein
MDLSSKQILALGAPEELACLLTNRLGEFESTRQQAHFAEPMCEVPFRFEPSIEYKLQFNWTIYDNEVIYFRRESRYRRF